MSGKQPNRPPVPTWTDAKVAAKESPAFAFLGEYVDGDKAIQVVPSEGRFYLSVYQGGLPGAGWDGGPIEHEWIEADKIESKLAGLAKLDRSSKLEFPEPPEGAIVLFDGSDMKRWAHGKMKDGLLQAGAKTKKDDFQDFRLHFESLIPFKPVLPLAHPRRGNSGVFALGAYEVQVCDTFGVDFAPDRWKIDNVHKKPNTWCGGIYGIRAADVNMCLPPLSWQTFDIEFTAARFDGKKKITDARMTVHQNGVKIHDDVAIPEGTGGGPKGPQTEVASGPIYFQNHNNPNLFRNIWVVAHQKVTPIAQSTSGPDLKIEFGPVKKSSVFESETQSHWGGSVVKGADGLYHMLYARWPKKLGWAWVTDSEIAHAVAPTPLGPFEHQDIALFRRGKEHWDGWCTHNPTVHKIGNKFYLYYMGNTGDGEVVGQPGMQKLNWKHRNNQRIGVAVADSPGGPWVRMDEPVLDVSEEDSAWDSLMTSNPSVCQRPDGGVLMVYKAVGKEFPLPSGGPVVHCVAMADSPTGPFVKLPDPVFTFEGERFPAEDPYIWFQDGKYRAIVKRIKHEGKRRDFSLVHYDSIDGIDWQPAKNHLISNRKITWEDGTSEQLDHLERPQVVLENGVPVALVCAADRIDENNVRHSFNVQIPLIVEVATDENR